MSSTYHDSSTHLKHNLTFKHSNISEGKYTFIVNHKINSKTFEACSVLCGQLIEVQRAKTHYSLSSSLFKMIPIKTEEMENNRGNTLTKMIQQSAPTIRSIFTLMGAVSVLWRKQKPDFMNLSDIELLLKSESLQRGSEIWRKDWNYKRSNR